MNIFATLNYCDCAQDTTRTCVLPNGIGTQSRSCPVNAETEWGDCVLTKCNEGYLKRDGTCVQVDSYTAAIARSMIDNIDRRLQGRIAEESMPLFVDVFDKGDAGVFTPNPDSWAQDLRSQFTGVHMNAGPWGPSYGLQAITPRHAISCGHNGPPEGTRLRYVNVDGTMFETKVLKWINDFKTEDKVADLSLYLLKDPLPDWVYKAPIVSFTQNQVDGLDSFDAPIVAVSQGYDGNKNTVGRKLYVRPVISKWPMSELRAPFWHNTYVGDSGTPQFAIINDRVYLFAITLFSGTRSGIQVGNYIDYINEMIIRADEAAGISTEYEVQPAVLPSESELNE